MAGCSDEKKNSFRVEQEYTREIIHIGSECNAGVGYKIVKTGDKTKDGMDIVRLYNLNKHATCGEGFLVSKSKPRK